MIVEKATTVEPSWNITEVLGILGIEFDIEGEPMRTFHHFAALSEASSDDLTFCSSEPEKAAIDVVRTDGGVILCKRQLKGLLQPKQGTQLVYVDNPRRTFVKVVKELQKRIKPQDDWNRPVISPTAIISPSAKIGKNCEIGNFVIVGENCVIGNDCRIHDRVSIGSNCRLGNNCVIQSGVTIGEDGFSYERYDSGELEQFPHFRAVIIGDNVEISSNVNIARGSLTDTIIGSGTKIDALVHIAHNVRIGRNCQLTGGTVIGGSTVIGDSCWTGLNSTLKDHARLGDNVIVGAGACVISNIPDGEIVAGVPAKSIKSRVSDPNLFLMAGQKRSNDTA
jgi:UDP-3-O-[3-hydroxymyristoyl] glucosamine N-acyltransferase